MTITWLTKTDGATPFERVLHRREDLFQALRDFSGHLWSDDLVDPVVLELCRLRIAQLHGCQSELMVRYESAARAGLTEEKIEQLSRAYESDLYDEHERGCIALAELFVADAHAISDADFRRAADGRSSRETMALLTAIATFDGLCRARLILGILPQADEPQLVSEPHVGGGPLY